MKTRSIFIFTASLLFSTLSYGIDLPEGLNQSDWQQIQSLIQAQQYQATTDEQGGYQATNKAHGWQINYQQNGQTSLTPLTGEEKYHINLQLMALGNDTSPAFSAPQKIIADGSTVSYQWNDNITEIWQNSASQLEQWFEIQQKPLSQQDQQTLVLKMQLNSNLAISQQGNNLNFDNKISYNKLKVWDTNGKILPASMLFEQNQLALIIDDSQATYPVTIDPSFQQVGYLKANNTGAHDHFGHSVAISGNTVVVGAPGEDSNTTGINAADNNVGNSTGRVYVFARSGGFFFPNSAWSLQASLKKSGAQDNDLFGFDVAIDGNTIVVGSPGNEPFGSGPESGVVTVFVRSFTPFPTLSPTWTQQANIRSSLAASYTGDKFGSSVDISGDSIIIGAPQEDSNAIDVGGSHLNNSLNNSGAAYVYTRSGTAWSRQAYLKASNTSDLDRFGTAVAIDGDRAVVGANQADTSVSQSGAAYVFARTGASWGTFSHTPFLEASNAQGGDWFGWSVDISDTTIIVGAPAEDSDSMGIDSTSNNSANEAGAVYIFDRFLQPTLPPVSPYYYWSETTYIKASNTDAADSFGWSVALSGEMAVVGARDEDSYSVAINDRPQNNSASIAGAAYTFSRDSSVWSQQDYLKATNSEAGDSFGTAVAIDAETVIVGANLENSHATGTNNGTSSNTAVNAGAAYVFDAISDATTLGDCDDDGDVDIQDVICTINIVLAAP